jgi:hypothetical protein
MSFVFGFLQDKGIVDFCGSSMQTNDNHFASCCVNSRPFYVEVGLPLLHFGSSSRQCKKEEEKRQFP